MNMNNDGGSAFPFEGAHDGQQFCSEPSGGMSLRDYFAASALQMMMRINEHDGQTVDARGREYAERAYLLADAMIEQRAK